LGQEGKEPGKRPALRSRLWAWTGFGDKTLWEWVQLLIVPVILSLITVVFSWQQEVRQNKLEDRRAKSERNIEEQRAQDAALQAYLDQMSTLMLDTDQDLRNSGEDSEVQTLARARTATVIQRLDADRNQNVIRFLTEANLTGDGQSSISLLAEADLQGARLEGVDLSTIDLNGAILGGANLSEANLSEANLSGANLSGANLNGANLIGANLSEANLSGANLSGAFLDGADLSYADLTDADLSDADLFGADLSDADLSYADLSGVEGVTTEMREQQAKSLRGATMPDGTVLSERYATREFEPALSLKLGHGWQLEESGVQERPDMLFIGGPRGPEERASLKFISPVHVFDPSNPSEPKEVPAPDNADGWASWFQKHPNLDTSEPVPMSVGGKSGVRIDVTSTPENSSAVYCGRVPCVYLFPAGGSGIVSYVRTKDRFVIVDVEGKTVVIHVSAPAGKFDEFLTKARKVLDTVEWKAG
jgi:uncharacterized protein YjbI with pentapeptide repeats